MRGVPFYIDERAIVPRSYHRRNPRQTNCCGESFRWSRSGAGQDACSISAPAPAASRSLRRCGFRRPRSMPPIFPRMRSRSPGRTSRCTACSAASGSLHGDLFAPIEGSALRPDRRPIRPTSTPRACAACRRNAGTSRRWRSTAARTASRSCGGSSTQAGRHLTPGGGLLCEVGRGRPALERAYPRHALSLARHRGEQRRGVLARRGAVR